MLYFCDVALHASIFNILEVSNNMDNKYDQQFIITQAKIESKNQDIKSNKQDSDEKIVNLTEDFKSIIVAITDQINTLKSSSTQKYLPKPL